MTIPLSIEAFHFDDNAPSANELAQLALLKRKRATAGLLWAFESQSKPVPKPGGQRVHTDYLGRECARLGRAFDSSMPVVCERFEVVYQVPGQ